MIKSILVVNSDFSGYGTAIARCFNDIGIASKLLSFKTAGVSSFLQDRLAPKLGIRLFHEKHISHAEQELQKTINEGNFDAVLLVFGDVIIGKNAIEALCKTHPQLKLILWLYDNIDRRPECATFLSLFDHIFTFDDSDLPKLKSRTTIPISPLYLFADTNHYLPVSSINKDIDISFVGAWVGNNYRKRRALLKTAASFSQANSLRFVVVGGSGFTTPLKFARDFLAAKGFRKYVRFGPLSHDEVNRLYQRSKIVINCPIDSQPNGYPMRTFEVPASGSCLLTQYMTGLESMFSRGSEIAIFNDLHDFIVQCSELLKNDTKRLTIAQAGNKKALMEHTLSARLKTMLNKIDG